MPFWSKAPQAPPASPNEFSNPTPEPTSFSTSGGFTDHDTPPPTTTTKPRPSRDELADAEFASVIAEINAEHRASTALEHRASIQGGAFHEEAQETVFPTEMSCTTAFDELFYCYSLGGQFQNVYRYGTYRDCAQKGKNFRFCMKTKMYGAAARRAMILNHYKQQEAKYKTGKSSEDVWTIRKTPLVEDPQKDASGASA